LAGLLKLVGHTGSMMDDPNTLFAAALGVVAIIIAIGKLMLCTGAVLTIGYKGSCDDRLRLRQHWQAGR
jgi:hypothetical protein